MKLQNHRLLAALGATVACAACARLTIEVDVYKGPLANEEAVQIQQLSVMAIGAYPLLTQLRDELEASGSPRYHNVQQLQAQPWYLEKWDSIPQTGLPVGHPEYPYFQDSWARRVQAILFLYEDAKQDPLGRYVQSALDHFEDYRAALAILQPVSDTADQRFWNGLMAHRSEESKRAGQGGPALWTAFKSFLAPDANDSYRNAARCVTACLAAGLRVRVDGLDVPTGDIGANAAFAALEQERLIREVAAILLEDTDQVRETFVARVLEVAHSFNRARGGLEGAFRNSLLYLRDSESDQSAMARERRQLAEEAVTSLLSPYYLAVAIKDPELAPRSAEYVVDNVQGLPDVAPSPEQFHSALTTYPLITDALLRLHDAFIADFAAPDGRLARFSTEPTPELATLRRRYGLVRGPTMTPESTTEVVETENKTQLRDTPVNQGFELSRGGLSGLGLDGGRLPEGLSSLIEAFLTASYDRDPAQVDRERNRLIDALVRFAEKLRILGTFDSLPATGSSSVSEYTETLSAISGSILATADALRGNEVHDRRQELDSGFESHSGKVQQVGSLPAPRTSKQALDRVITRLRHALILATESGNADQVGRIEDALEVAEAQRSGMVQIRPAAAFLRSSYLTVRHQAGSEGARTSRNAQSIDRQFWQRVNTIELTGTGTTQYVLVKDDVGNWYVKGFSANVDKMIESAKSVAMFAAAGSVSPAALAQAKALMSGKASDADEDQAAGAAAIAALVEKEMARTKAALKTILETLAVEAEESRERIEASWDTALEAKLPFASVRFVPVDTDADTVVQPASDLLDHRDQLTKTVQAADDKQRPELVLLISNEIDGAVRKALDARNKELARHLTRMDAIGADVSTN